MVIGHVAFIMYIFWQYFKKGKIDTSQDIIEAFEMETFDREVDMEAANDEKPYQGGQRTTVLLGRYEIEANAYSSATN